MTRLAIALLCLAVVPGSFSNDDIHKYMSRDECQQVFQTDHASVPKYEVAKVHFSERSHKRAAERPAGSKLHVRAFGQDINLWLHPSESSVLYGEDTPVYYAKYSPSKTEGVEYTRRDGLMRMVGRIFEDPGRMASLVIGTEDSGRARINGYVESSRLAVRSLPPRVAEEYRRRRRSVGDSDDLDSPYHIVFEVNDDLENYPALPVNQTALRQRISRSASGIPDTLYPKILVVVEYSLYSSFGRDIYGLLQYLMAFWNGVDLKYRSLESPKFRFHIAGIVLAEDYRATPYISNYSLGDNVFNQTEAMYNVGEFYGAVQDTFPLYTYDISVTMTKQKLGIHTTIVGLAWIAHACKHLHTYYRTSSSALVKDDGIFNGVHVAAHELGHLFGAQHDNSSGDCALESGFLMTFTPRYTTNSSDFSSCSIDRFETELTGGKLDCLFHPPRSPGKSLPKLMPGRMKTLDEQCKSMGHETACENKSGPTDVCVSMFCRHMNGNCYETGGGALDGTTCEGNKNKFCLHMQCVSL